MEIGNQIKSLRLRRGITQEAMANHFGITAQAISKWERGVAMPDISMLPELSAYFGVTIDELFALSDETRMERIQNMIWDNRYLNPADVENEKQFLLEKAGREPSNSKPYALLAELENHLAYEHQEFAAQYAKEALCRGSEDWEPLQELMHAMRGKEHDWNFSNHYKLISFCKEYVKTHPENWQVYLPLLDQLIDDYRLEEAKEYCDKFASVDNSYRVPLYRGMIAWQEGTREEAFRIWAQMEKEFSEDWCVWHNIGDYLVRDGRMDEAMEYYRKALDVQEAPRLTDPCEAMAQLCEIRGNYVGAIAALEEQLKLMEKEWKLTEGEAVDSIHREIARLQKA